MTRVSNIAENQLMLPSGKVITFNDDQFEGINKIKSWLNNSDGKNFFTLAGYAGTGKEQPIDSKVYTPYGSKNIGDLKIGDEVFGINGNINIVVGVFPQGMKQAYKITFRDETHTECGEEHLWNVWTHKLRQQKKPTITKTLKQIVDSGLTFRSGIHKFSIPLCKPVQYSEKELPIHPYLLGVLIGDGCLMKKTPIISTPDLDSEIITIIKKLLPENYRITEDRYSSCPRYEIVDDTEYHKNGFGDILFELGLNVTSEFKFIPDIYKYASVEQRWELLRGLMDADGTSGGNRIGFSTSSPQLKNDIIELVQSLGGVAILNQNDVRHNNINYSINIKTFENPFKLKRKANSWKFSTKNPPSRHITSIEKSRMVEQVCIMIDSEDGLYLTDNYIVTHNSTIVKKILDKYRGGVVVSAPTHKAKKVIINTTKRDGQTLHRLLGLRPDLDLDNFNPNDPKFNPIAPPKITDYNFVIIDEASMINQELYDLILDKVSKGRTKVLFMGDPAQIPPVGERESVVFFQEQEEKIFHQLTKIERQDDGNPLILYYDALRNNLEDMDGGIKRISKFNERGEGILFTVRKKQFRNAVLEQYSTSDFKQDTDFCKLIAWKNDTVMLSNQVIREELLNKTSDIIEMGDLLMGYRTISDKSLRFNIIENSADYIVVDKSGREENEYGLMGFRVKLRESLARGEYAFQNVFIVDANDKETLDTYGQMHDFFRDMSKSNKKMWPKYYEFRRNNILMKTINKYPNGLYRSDSDIIVKDMDYGYAITAHKCLSENTNVLTNVGNVKLKDIQIGDYVSIGSNKYKLVTNKFDSGIKKSFELTTKSGYKIRCSEDHRILDSRNKFKPLRDFNVGEFIPINRNEFKDNIVKSKDINYFLGLIVADGSYGGNRKRDKYRIDLTIGLLDVENIEFIGEFYQNNNIKYGIIKKKYNCAQFYNSGKDWRTKLFELGLDYVKGEEKSTPISILNGTHQMRSNFIAGLFDGNGHVSKRGQIILVNNSNKLLSEVQEMLLEFGIISYIRQEKKSFRLVIINTSIDSFKKHISFRLKRKKDMISNYFPTVKTNVDFIPHKEEIFEMVKSDLTEREFYLKNKGLNPVDFKIFPNHVKHLSYENLNNIIKLYEFNEKPINTKLLDIKNNYYFYDEIVSITYVGDEQMYDLEVDEIHQYVANGFIVHNSQGSTYTHVFVMENDINENWLIKERNQIKYVALTRPTTTASVLTTKIDT